MVRSRCAMLSIDLVVIRDSSVETRELFSDRQVAMIPGRGL